MPRFAPDRVSRRRGSVVVDPRQWVVEWRMEDGGESAGGSSSEVGVAFLRVQILQTRINDRVSGSGRKCNAVVR